MTFQELQIGDSFILPNQIPTRNGVPSLIDVDELEVYQKIQPATLSNEILCGKTKFTQGLVDSNAVVIKLIF